MTSFFRRAVFAVIIAGAISLPAAAQIGTSDLGGSAISRRGRYTVTGSVHDEGERPLESVEVRLSSLSAGVAASTYTNSNGGFAFSDVPAGSYYLVIEEDGYEKVREEVNFSNPLGIQIGLRRAANPFQPEKVGNGPTVSAREFSIPRRAREAMDRGMNLVHQKSDYRASISEFQRAVKEYPQYYEAYMQMGVAYTKLGDLAKSEQSLRTSIDLSQHHYADALFTLAAVYSSQKRFTEAEPLAREAVKVNAGSWEANLELARSLYGIDQTEEAEASAVEALRIQPENPSALLLLANIHLKLRNYPELINDLDKYLELAPNGPQADQARQMREQVFSRIANIQPRATQ